MTENDILILKIMVGLRKWLLFWNEKSTYWYQELFLISWIRIIHIKNSRFDIRLRQYLKNIKTARLVDQIPAFSTCKTGLGFPTMIIDKKVFLTHLLGTRTNIVWLSFLVIRKLIFLIQQNLKGWQWSLYNLYL